MSVFFFCSLFKRVLGDLTKTSYLVSSSPLDGTNALDPYVLQQFYRVRDLWPSNSYPNRNTVPTVAILGNGYTRVYYKYIMNYIRDVNKFATVYGVPYGKGLPDYKSLTGASAGAQFRLFDENGIEYDIGNSPSYNGTEYTAGSSDLKEMMLDIQTVVTLCPMCQILYFSMKSGFVETAFRSAAQYANVVSVSYGVPEVSSYSGGIYNNYSRFQSLNQVIADYPNVTFIACTGDSGYDYYGGSYNIPVSNRVANKTIGWWPAAHPGVVAVGGTHVIGCLDCTTAR